MYINAQKRPRTVSVRVRRGSVPVSVSVSVSMFGIAFVFVSQVVTLVPAVFRYLSFMQTLKAQVLGMTCS